MVFVDGTTMAVPPITKFLGRPLHSVEEVTTHLVGATTSIQKDVYRGCSQIYKVVSETLARNLVGEFDDVADEHGQRQPSSPAIHIPSYVRHF